MLLNAVSSKLTIRYSRTEYMTASVAVSTITTTTKPGDKLISSKHIIRYPTPTPFATVRKMTS